MILPLRKLHRRTFAVLAVALALLFAAGIAVRKATPHQPLPGTNTTTEHWTATPFDRDDVFTRSPVRLRLWRESSSRSLGVGLNAPREFLKPDLLVYMSSAPSARGDVLPAEATLLGAFGGGPWTIPADAQGSEVFVILFSLANQQVVDISKPLRLEAPAI